MQLVHMVMGSGVGRMTPANHPAGHPQARLSQASAARRFR